MRITYTSLKQWMDTPLEQGLPDDDGDYKKVSLLDGKVVLSEVTECITRPVYDLPVDIHGNKDDSMLLPGGMKGGKVYGAEHVVQAIEESNRELKLISGGSLQWVVIEVARLPFRQEAGNRKAFNQMISAAGITDPTPADVLIWGREATKIFSYVQSDKASSQYIGTLTTLGRDARLLQSLRDAAKLTKDQPIDSVLEEYIGMAASLGYGEIGAAKIPLRATHMVHGSAAAWDAFIADGKGRILAHTPFDYPDATLASYRFLESDANYEVLKKEMATKPLLMDHYRKMGVSGPDAFTFKHFQMLQKVNRVKIRLVVAMNGTTYMEEAWHFEFGTIWNRLNGEQKRHALAASHPLSGGPGLTAIRLGAKGQAVWHTDLTLRAAQAQGLLISA